MRRRSDIESVLGDVYTGKKKWVRYDEGAKLYSLGYNTFTQLAKDAKAVYHLKKIVLVNTEIIDEYLEAFKDNF